MVFTIVTHQRLLNLKYACWRMYKQLTVFMSYQSVRKKTVLAFFLLLFFIIFFFAS